MRSGTEITKHNYKKLLGKTVVLAIDIPIIDITAIRIFHAKGPVEMLYTWGMWDRSGYSRQTQDEAFQDMFRCRDSSDTRFFLLEAY